jgi:hypothetical protein
MTAPMEGYYEVDPAEGFGEHESAFEARRPLGRVFAAGGLTSATLNTPRGPAQLNLPSPVPTLAQFRTLEQAVNTNSARLNTELAALRREIAARRQDPNQAMFPLIFGLLGQRRLREELEGHRHDEGTGAVILPAAGGGDGSFSLLLPLLFLQPNLFGQGGSASSGGGMGGMSPLLLMLLFMDRL